MKRLALIAAIFTFAACSAKEEAPEADTSTPAAAAVTDSVADSMDHSMHMDSVAKPDSTQE